jgi:hypothetical protein
MCNQFDEFIPGDAIILRPLKMGVELLGAMECNQGCDRNETPVSLGQAGTLPNVTKEKLFGEFSELGCNVCNRRSWARYRRLR